MSVSFIRVGFHGGGICLFSNAFQSNPSKNGCALSSSASFCPEPNRNVGSRTKSRVMRLHARGEKRFYLDYELPHVLRTEVRQKEYLKTWFSDSYHKMEAISKENWNRVPDPQSFHREVYQHSTSPLLAHRDVPLTLQEPHTRGFLNHVQNSNGIPQIV